MSPTRSQDVKTHAHSGLRGETQIPCPAPTPASPDGPGLSPTGPWAGGGRPGGAAPPGAFAQSHPGEALHRTGVPAVSRMSGTEWPQDAVFREQQLPGRGTPCRQLEQGCSRCSWFVFVSRNHTCSVFVTVPVRRLVPERGCILSLDLELCLSFINKLAIMGTGKDRWQRIQGLVVVASKALDFNVSLRNVDSQVGRSGEPLPQSWLLVLGRCSGLVPGALAAPAEGRPPRGAAQRCTGPPTACEPAGVSGPRGVPRGVCPGWLNYFSISNAGRNHGLVIMTVQADYIAVFFTFLNDFYELGGRWCIAGDRKL